MTVTGYPIREDLRKWDKVKAREYFQLDDSLPTILFMGGSSGAHSINEAVMENLTQLLEKFQIIHLTGHNDWDSIQSKTLNANHRYHAFPYLHEMGAALAAADLAVSRSGASVLGEYPWFGLPAILVPYPHAWHYQKVNADYLVDRNAAVLLRDEELKTNLMPTINKLFETPQTMQKMSAAMTSLAKPHAAERIAELLFEMAEA